MSSYITESELEDAALQWFSDLGYTIVLGPDIAPGEEEQSGVAHDLVISDKRKTYSDVILENHFFKALKRINPNFSQEELIDISKKLTRPEFPLLINNNHAFHKMLVEGIPCEKRDQEGRTCWEDVKLIDFEYPENNSWLAVNQFTIIEGNKNRRPDIIIFVNGLPLAVFELKNLGDENATLDHAFNQIQTYKKDIEQLFIYNEVNVISDGLEARVGSLSANIERFMPWRTIEGEEVAPSSLLQLEVLIRGLFNKRRFLDYIKYFIVFDSDGSETIKKIAGYHQFHAVRNAVITTVKATSPEGDKRCGVVWHTQGSGKSLTMAFYSGMIIQHSALENPTIVVITDRNDLDDQLFTTFSRCNELLRQKPVQIENREDLRNKLQVASGGVLFTTIQKFLPEQKGDSFPLLSDRKNIIVIADEAHRSQYDFIDGFARHMRDAMPSASYIGFTGTPIETDDKITTAVFGDYISIYDIQRAVQDGSTVPIYYEARLAKLQLQPEEMPQIDPEFEELTENEEEEEKVHIKRKWAAMEKIVGADRRIKIIAQDIVNHYQNRKDTMDGKAMIVCMSRRICVDLYNELIKLKPDWHSDEDEKGSLKIVMTGSASDDEKMQLHIRSKARREALANRFKNPKDQFDIVIVRDMWLTGFDAPSLHTMYIDKPMRGHTLMQAIARVNRVFKDKPGGLVVDYLGIADDLRRAMANYTESGGEGKTAIDQDEAVAIMKEKYEICRDMFHGFDYTDWTSTDPTKKVRLIPPAQEYILGQEDGKDRFVKAVTSLSKAFALAVPHDETVNIRDDVGFFQAVRTALTKSTLEDRQKESLIEEGMRQIISKAVASDDVIDIFTAAGLKKPDISILSDEFLDDVKKIPHKNLAIETLKKLLNDEIKLRSRKNLIQSKEFSKMLEETLKRYRNKALTSAEIIAALIGLAKEMREAYRRGEALGLEEDELAFFDALEVNDSAVKILGDETLRQIAVELVETVRNNIAIDWTVKESVKAKLRLMIKKVLRKHDYPPDKEKKATETVLQQAELLAKEWVPV